MSTVCYLRQVTDAQITDLLKKPDQITAFLAAPAAEPSSGLLGRLFGKKSQASTAVAPAGEQIDLHQAWHGLHYILTLSDWEGDEPLCYLLKGGAAIGAVSLGYGPARALRPAQVAALSNALANCSPEVMSYCFNPEEMARLEIYPGIWDQDKAFEYLMEYYAVLMRFVKDAAGQGNGLIVYLQ